MIILDTNVLSEAMRPVAAEAVLRWLAIQPASRLFTTTITQAEILYGLDPMPKGKRRSALQSAVEAMFEEDFPGRILPFDSDAARVFPQIAAIARSRDAALATRNTSDFEHCGIRLLDPWGAR
jgi:hypothetical protein